jgi:hypothetical protein
MVNSRCGEEEDAGRRTRVSPTAWRQGWKGGGRARGQGAIRGHDAAGAPGVGEEGGGGAVGAQQVNRELLIKELDAQRLLMITVSTGRGPGIDSANDEYVERHELLRRELKSLALDYPVPFDDLWRWHGKWSSGDLPTWKSRREYISDLFGPIMEAVRQRSELHGARMFPEPTGWAKVDSTLDLIRRRLEQAKTEAEWQSVGHACREVLIDLAQSVYEPTKHPTSDGVTPSSTDADRQLQAYLNIELGGGSNEAARRHAKAALAFAEALQHRRTATFRDAALCAEATTSVVNLSAIISGRRNP